jgi:hypothetical protein
MSKRAPFRLTAPKVLEHPLQRQMCDVLRLEIAPPGRVSADGVVWYAIDHANFAGEVPGIRISRGIVAGIPDLFLLWQGRAYLVEIKTLEGVLSEAQQSVIAAVLASGGRVGVARTVDELLVCLDGWGIPRRHRVPAARPMRVSGGVAA